MRGSKPGCGGTGRGTELKLLNSTRLFHMHSRKEKEGLSIPPALNGVADSDLQVSGGLGGGGQGALMQSLRKERDWLSKSFFLALRASVRPKNKEDAWTPPLVPPTICV